MVARRPLLAGTLGAAWIDGVQSRRVGAVAKHLVCNDSETLRDRYDAIVDEATLRQVYLLPFQFAARAGCAGMMAAYNKVNGTHCAEHAGLLTTILRGEWNYTGFTVCDWFGSVSTAPAMSAGLDLEMPGPARFYGAKLAAAVDAGEVPAETVIAAATRVAGAARAWADGDAGPEPGDRDTVLADAAAASFVLLRNDGDLLPIAPGSVGTLAVIGPNAIAPCLQGGTFAKVALRPDAIMPVDALKAVYGADTVRLAPGCDPSPRLPAIRAVPARDLGDGCTRGLTVEYFAGHDFTTEPLGSETRDTNSLTWFGGMPGIGAFGAPGGVRAAGIVAPERSGTHHLHIGGTGSVRVLVDGCEILSVEQEFAPADVMGVLKGGDSRSVAIDLIAGQPVLIEAELRFQPARAQGLWYGLRAPGDAGALLDEAEALARDADAVLLVVGETADSGVESKDRDTTALPVDQQSLAARVIAANPNTVVVANVAHAFDPAIADGAAALMIVWYPGEAFGPALASVIAGTREPSGRLPMTIAARETDYPILSTQPDAAGHLSYHEGVAIGHRGFADRGIAPAHPFGAGMGYGDLRCLSAVTDGMNVIVTVANDAARSSVCVVQAYDPDGALVGFGRAVVLARATIDVTMPIEPLAKARWFAKDDESSTAPTVLRIGMTRANLPLVVRFSPTG